MKVNAKQAYANFLPREQRVNASFTLRVAYGQKLIITVEKIFFFSSLRKNTLVAVSNSK